MSEKGRVSTRQRGEVAVPRLPARSPDGVDLTLVRWMLSMTPAQRLKTLQHMARSLARLRAQGREP